MRRGSFALLAAVFLASAAWVRVSRTSEVFVDGEVVARGEDAPYRVFRTLETAADFPRVRVEDPWLDWPRGAYLPWSTGIERAGALLVLAARVGSEPREAAGVVALLPVLLGLIALFAAMHVAKTLAQLAGSGAPAALAARAGVADPIVGSLAKPGAPGARATSADLIAESPAEPEASAARAGGGARVAHAGGAPRDADAVGLAAMLLGGLMPAGIAASDLGRFDVAAAELCAAMLILAWSLARVSLERPSRARALRFELLGAVLLAGALHLSSGSVWAAAAAALVLVSMALTDPAPWGMIGSGAPAFAAAALVLAPDHAAHVALHHRAFDLAAVSWAQPLVLAACAVLLASARRRTFTRAARVLAALTVLVLLAASPPAPSADPWTLARIHRAFGLIGLGTPLLLPLGLIAARRRDRRTGTAFALFALAALLAAALLQSASALALVALLAAIWTVLALDLLAARARTRSSRDALLLLAAGAAIALDPELQSEIVPSFEGKLPAVQAAGFHLRDHEPPVEPGRASAVVTDPELAHELRGLGDHPTLSAPRETWLSDEDALLALMETRDAAYLVAGPAGALPKLSPLGEGIFERNARGAVVFNPDYFHELPLSPLLIGGSGAPVLGIRHLEHFMPRFGSEDHVSGSRLWLPKLWVYERVRGAKVIGAVPPDAHCVRVVASIWLRVHGDHVEWFAWTDPVDGRFELTLPLPSGFSNDSIISRHRYKISFGREVPPIHVEVPEEAVREGETIRIDP